jgi:hypothetical protein
MILPHPKSRVKMTMPRRRLRPKLVLVLACAPATSAGADAALRAPVLMTLDGVSGARPGMSVDAVSKYWGMRLRPSYEVSPTCGQAFLDRSGIEGYAIFKPRGRFGAVFLRKGAVTGRGIRSGRHSRS